MTVSLKHAARKGEWLELKLPAELGAGPELQRFLLDYTPIPPNMLKKLHASHGIRHTGQRLALKLFPPEAPQFVPEWIDIDILYEDDFCLVASKPAGLAVHPASAERTGTLANAVAFHYESTGQACRVRHIHRLDADTTGPVLYAKNEFAQLVLDEAMRAKAIERIYVAVVAGRMNRRRGRIEEPIGKDRHHPGRRRVSATGDPAVTHYEVVAQWRDAALVRLRLETGRTHQIRVHLSHIGHPIWGDALYGGPAKHMRRQALHGETLRFAHPWTGELMQVDCPWPDDIRQLIDQFQHGKET